MRRLLIPLLAWACAAPATAQIIGLPTPNPNPGNLENVYIPGSQEDLNAKQVREGMVKFARCVAGRHFAEANAFVLKESEDTWNALSKKVDEDCVLAAVENPSGEVRVSSNSQDLLFALAEVLVQKRMAAFDPAQIKTAATLQIADPLGAFGECAVRANPIGAHDVLKARINSKEETQAIQAMMPAFSGCIPSGVQVHPNLTTLRGVVAVAYYRLGNAPKTQTATAKIERGR